MRRPALTGRPSWKPRLISLTRRFRTSCRRLRSNARQPSARLKPKSRSSSRKRRLQRPGRRNCSQELNKSTGDWVHRLKPGSADHWKESMDPLIRQGSYREEPVSALIPIRTVLAYALSSLCLILPTLTAGQAASNTQSQDEELQMGQEVFDQLKAKGEIIESSPLYDQLKPIADSITQAAQPRYNHPFKFYLVHETQPNAFATPGGNVYVVDSLLYFVKNKEQLAHQTKTDLLHGSGIGKELHFYRASLADAP